MEAVPCVKRRGMGGVGLVMMRGLVHKERMRSVLEFKRERLRLEV